MLGPNDLPFAVGGHRTLILEKAPKEKTAGGLHIPKVAQVRYFSGILMDAGLPARDKLYDQGYQIGDEVEFGMYAGLREAWDHIVEGDPSLPDDAYDWRFVSEDPVRRVYQCSNTMAVRYIESVIVLNVDDLIASVELAQRQRRGEIRVIRGVTADGKTQHVYERASASDLPTPREQAAMTEERSNVNGH